MRVIAFSYGRNEGDKELSFADNLHAMVSLGFWELKGPQGPVIEREDEMIRRKIRMISSVASVVQLVARVQIVAAGEPITQLIIASHGGPDVIAIGKEDLITPDNAFTEHSVLSLLADSFAPSATVTLLGCAVADGTLRLLQVLAQMWRVPVGGYDVAQEPGNVGTGLAMGPEGNLWRCQPSGFCRLGSSSPLVQQLP
ncbi:MAG: DUF4347 domain-containing protein [Deltaproteobacteria bacterium]|nr:DUF4347 domain-containing protein [Deltaproteobacteria bacterium]